MGLRQARERTIELLNEVGIPNPQLRVNSYPHEMSGGQQQRVACARALVSRPSIVFADEPTGNLDSASGAAIVALLRELNEQGTTIAVITHDRELASSLPRQVEMRDGRVIPCA
jgi:putative ABC transport system ATP-binding protein